MVQVLNNPDNDGLLDKIEFFRSKSEITKAVVSEVESLMATLGSKCRNPTSFSCKHINRRTILNLGVMGAVER